MQMTQIKTFHGVVMVNNKDSFQEMLVHIENQKLYFYASEKKAMFEKIKSRLDRQFYLVIPKPEVVKMLSKKL